MKLVMLTNKFPYEKGENFLETEIEFAKGFEKIVILPWGVEDYESARKINNKDVDVYCGDKQKRYKGIKKIVMCLVAFFTLQAWREMKELCHQHKFTVKKMINLLSFISEEKRVLKKYQQYLNGLGFQKNDTILFYSYWLSNAAYIALQLKKTYKHACVVSRTHGYDLYKERAANQYLPFQSYIVENIDMVYCISEDGKNYLDKEYPKYTHKIKIARLGTSNFGEHLIDYDKKKLEIVSCSWVTPVKRIELIVKILCCISDIPIKWTHYGSGSELPKIKVACKELPSNIEVDFRGSTANQVVLEEYQKYDYHVFINVSESEGLPVSIMEALSFGIPVIATDVGGNSEIVSKESGYLIRKDFEPEEVANILKNMYKLDKNEYKRMRNKARNIWEEEYKADKNYTEFYMDLKKIANNM
ncbi:MAG: glycosyltransferase [Lachnospiraceae bacterium]